jgi:predicted DCC family thiol-disulfide oxidoreductase YuxK
MNASVSVAPAPSAASEPRLIVLYDRDCGLCTATAKRLRRWDRAGRLVLLPLQEAPTSVRPGLAETARDLPLTAVLHVVDERTGAVHAGGDAAIAIGTALPGVGSLARVVGSVAPVRWGIGRAYDFVARNRHRIGRWLRLEGPACDVPR